MHACSTSVVWHSGAQCQMKPGDACSTKSTSGICSAEMQGRHIMWMRHHAAACMGPMMCTRGGRLEHVVYAMAFMHHNNLGSQCPKLSTADVSCMWPFVANT
jgi:hypothetical protein